MVAKLPPPLTCICEKIDEEESSKKIRIKENLKAHKLPLTKE